MVGPYGDWLRFPFENTEHLFLIPEEDSCRVITDSAVEILQRVPPETAQLLRLGSIETPAMLLDASDAFAAGSPSSEETARSISQSGHLAEAMDVCLTAATREFDIGTQKRLLRAASYGMHFLYKQEDEDETTIMGGPIDRDPDGPDDGVRPSSTAIKFVAAARKLRILNALRNPKVGFLATSAQFDAMTPTGVVARLIAMKRPALASCISSYLNLPKSVQLYARACKAAAVVQADQDRSDSEVAEEAVRIIAGSAQGSAEANNTLHRGAYATVALAATAVGRTGVANLLLLLESSVADKVPALIATGSYADALAVASNARDSDYIFTTLMEFERSCTLAQPPPYDAAKAQASFFATVVSKFPPEGFHTLRRYLQTQPEAKSETTLLLKAQKFSTAGASLARRAFVEQDTREKHLLLQEASRIFGLSKDTQFQKAATEDYLELLRDQELLRTKHSSRNVCPETSSIMETISAVIKFAATNPREQHRLLSDADKLAKKYRVPEKRYWHMKVIAFADSNQWSNIRLMADAKKSPIGFKPFAMAAIKGKQSVTEIQKYIDRVQAPEERYTLYCEASIWKKALDEARRLSDPRRVQNVRTLCNSQEIQAMADELLGRMAQ